MASLRCARRVAAAAQQQGPGNTAAFVAAGAGAVAAALAVDAALEACGVPQEQAHAAVVACVGAVATTGMVQRGPFRDDPWEHSAEMMARSDAGLMGPTSARPPLQPTLPGAPAHAALRDQGVVRLDGVLSAESVSAARSAVIERLDAVLSEQPEGTKPDRAKLGKVMCSKSRYDLLLQPDSGAVEAAMRQALAGPVGDLMKAAVGLNASLYELAALVSDNGAGRQPVQVDTPYQGEAPMYTAFVALQDESVELGPTLFLPGTHTAKAYADFMGGDKKRSDLLQQTPFFGSLLSAGDAAIFDSRLLHAEAQNVAGQRAVLYFTFAKPAADLSRGFPGSIAPEAKGFHRLADFMPKA